MQQMLESDFSFWEATQAIDQIKLNKNGGPDKITSNLLKFLFKLSSYLIISVLYNISNAILGNYNYFSKRYVMFILKPNTVKKDIKMLTYFSNFQFVKKCLT